MGTTGRCSSVCRATAACHSGALRERLVWEAQQGAAADDKYLGRIRLEAATGEDFSDAIDIPKPDGMAERAFQFVKWLSKENPQESGSSSFGGWKKRCGGRTSSWRVSRTVRPRRRGLRFIRKWTGSSCSPPARSVGELVLAAVATPSNRFFVSRMCSMAVGAAIINCRSWELLGLNQYGPIVNVRAVEAAIRKLTAAHHRCRREEGCEPRSFVVGAGRSGR